MLIRIPRGWELPEAMATPEAVVMNRRGLLLGAGAVGAAVLWPRQPRAEQSDPTADLYPAPRNTKYTVERAITPEEINTRYNNFYEFGSHKQIYAAAEKLKVRPWEIKIDGDVEKPFTIEVDELVRRMGLEERVYRHRCVEAWSMVVAWTGFPLAKLVAFANPLAKAKYVRMETFLDKDVAHGQRAIWYPWPYVEGVTMAEANNDLAFMVTGAYGKPLPKSMGAPIRLHLPWKYGFKSIKSIVRITFTDQRPKSFWEEVQGSEYGFWANVNPAVPHPRWSQAHERVLGTDETVPTQIFNGYGEFVADLYRGLEGERLFM